jgi:hypothetical protein
MTAQIERPGGYLCTEPRRDLARRNERLATEALEPRPGVGWPPWPARLTASLAPQEDNAATALCRLARRTPNGYLHPLDQIEITELPESIDGRAECLALLDEVLIRIDAIPGYDRIPPSPLASQEV